MASQWFPTAFFDPPAASARRASVGVCYLNWSHFRNFTVFIPSFLTTRWLMMGLSRVCAACWALILVLTVSCVYGKSTNTDASGAIDRATTHLACCGMHPHSNHRFLFGPSGRQLHQAAVSGPANDTAFGSVAADMRAHQAGEINATLHSEINWSAIWSWVQGGWNLACSLTSNGCQNPVTDLSQMGSAVQSAWQALVNFVDGQNTAGSTASTSRRGAWNIRCNWPAPS